MIDYQKRRDSILRNLGVPTVDLPQSHQSIDKLVMDVVDEAMGKRITGTVKTAYDAGQFDEWNNIRTRLKEIMENK